jgi:hypothetical protein
MIDPSALADTRAILPDISLFPVISGWITRVQ